MTSIYLNNNSEDEIAFSDVIFSEILYKSLPTPVSFPMGNDGFPSTPNNKEIQHNPIDSIQVYYLE